jgi:hypothetical protein
MIDITIFAILILSLFSLIFSLCSFLALIEIDETRHNDIIGFRNTFEEIKELINKKGGRKK